MAGVLLLAFVFGLISLFVGAVVLFLTIRARSNWPTASLREFYGWMVGVGFTLLGLVIVSNVLFG